MGREFLIIYPGLLIISSIYFKRNSLTKLSRIFFSFFQIILSSIISANIIFFSRAGDFKVYLKIFEICANINNCLEYSPFEIGFTTFIGFINGIFNFNSNQIWILINLINLTLIVYISKKISELFNDNKLFLSIQTLITGFCFPSFLLISIRSGLSFLICSVVIINLLNAKNIVDNKNFYFYNIFLLITALSVHLQSFPIILFICFFYIYYIYKEKEINNSEIYFFRNLSKGFLSKKIFNYFLLICISLLIVYNNFTRIFRFIGKGYYYLNPLRGRKSIGFRSIIEQFIISNIILPEIKSSNYFLEDKKCRNFVNYFSIFQIFSIIFYYLVFFSLGIDGFARICQYNFLVFLIMNIIVLKKYNFKSLIPFLYAIFIIYYTFLRDKSFSGLY